MTPLTNIAQCPIDEWAALKAFYESTNGDNWKNRTGWDLHIANHNSPADDCNLAELFGIIVQPGSDSTEPRVTSLRFSGNGLTGTIPAEIGMLTYLEYFNLQYMNQGDQLTGKIPKELGSLKNLQYLSLISNQLTGEIPAELGNLSSLNYLNLNYNQLSGSIPSELGNISRLFELNLTGNQLSGTIPAELGKLNPLVNFSLGGNQLTGNIPIELSNFTNLDRLSLGNNQLTGVIPPELGNLTSLVGLALSDNQLTGSIPAELGNLTNLRGLLIYNNQLSGCFPNTLTLFCDRPASSTNETISDGNDFDAAWEDFCTNKEGACPPNSTNSNDLLDSIDFVYDQTSQTINITSSNLPIEHLILFNANSQIIKNIKVEKSSKVKVDVAGLANGIYIAEAAINGKRFQTNIVISK